MVSNTHILTGLPVGDEDEEHVVTFKDASGSLFPSAGH